MPWFPFCTVPSLSWMSGNCGSGALCPAPSLAYLASFQIFWGFSIASLTVALQDSSLSFLTCFPLACEAARYAARLSPVLSWLHSLLSFLVCPTALLHSFDYVIFAYAEGFAFGISSWIVWVIYSWISWALMSSCCLVPIGLAVVFSASAWILFWIFFQSAFFYCSL